MKVLKTIFRTFLFGFVAGVLLAPRSGTETRRMLSERFNSLLEGANSLADKLDYSSAEGGTSAASVPKQEYANSGAAREVGGNNH
jgi:gas vesicle protein